MPLPYTVTYTIRDEKGATSTPTFYLDGAASPTDAKASATEALKAISLLTDGALDAASIVLPIDVSGIGLSAPLSGSDVEEGARFQYTTVQGFFTSQRIPCFKESLIVAGGNDVDQSDANVVAYRDGMFGSWDGTPSGGTGLVKTVDSRNEQTNSLRSAVESFQRSRST